MTDEKPADQVPRRTMINVARAGAAVFTTMLLGLMGVVLVPAAHAAPELRLPLLLCTGSETLGFDPPLTDTSEPTDVTFDINLSPCLIGGVTGQPSEGEFEVSTSCNTLDELPPGFTDTYMWTNRTSSVVTYSVASQELVNGNVVIIDEGTVTSGFDQGASAVEQAIFPETDLAACSGTGVSGLTGEYTLTFL